MNTDNIIFMIPDLRWNSYSSCSFAENQQVTSKGNFPSDIPFGDACWSHLDYVGEYVDLPFVVNVLLGNTDSVKQISGVFHPKVIHVCILQINNL